MSEARVKGRNPFPVLDGDNDYSGRDFDYVFLKDSKALSHAFLNGVTLSNSVFLNVDLDQCEFGEAQFTKTNFVNASLDGSDFVRATFSESSFENCDLSDGEWRESIFDRVRFLGCKFSHTTVNLCIFIECEFADGSTVGLDYKAVNYNVFSKCRFDRGIASETVLSRNFGLKPAQPASSLIQFGQNASLEQICLTSGEGRVSIYDLIQAISKEFTTFRGRMKKLRLEFISNILKILTSERRIAASSLVYIEGMLSALGSTALEDGDPQAILSAFVTVRNALLELSTATHSDAAMEGALCTKVVLIYDSEFSEEYASAMVKSIDTILTDGQGGVALASVQRGSTIITMDIQGMVCSAVAVLGAINLFVSQLTTSVKRIKTLRKTLVKTKVRPRKPTKRQELVKRNPGFLFSGEQPVELIRVRKAVQENGMIIIRMDEPAVLKLFIQEDGMRATKD
ncbi:hypothetical protein BH11PSE4_BH11PSE4_38860 [soil metagenome]